MCTGHPEGQVDLPSFAHADQCLANALAIPPKPLFSDGLDSMPDGASGRSAPFAHQALCNICPEKPQVWSGAWLRLADRYARA